MFGFKRRSTDELLRYFVTGELERALDMPLEEIPRVNPPRVVHVDDRAYLLQAYFVMPWSWLGWLYFKYANWRAPEGQKVEGRLPFMPPVEYTLCFSPHDRVDPELPPLERISPASKAPPSNTLSATFGSLNSLEDHLRDFRDYASTSTPTINESGTSTVLEDFMAQQQAAYE